MRWARGTYGRRWVVARLVSSPAVRRIRQLLLAAFPEALHENVDEDADGASNSEGEEYGPVEHQQAPARIAMMVPV